MDKENKCGNQAIAIKLRACRDEIAVAMAGWRTFTTLTSQRWIASGC